MCDMRGSPTQAIVKSTNEIIDLKYCGCGNEKMIEVGIYHVGASGCGYVHHDGTLVGSINGRLMYNLDAVGPWENEKYIYGKDGKFGKLGSESSEMETLHDWQKEIGRKSKYV